MNNDPGDPNGVVSLVSATANSINCAYLRLAHEVTLPKLVAVAKSMGVSDPLSTTEPSIVLGTNDVHPIEMTAAYATVADGGIYHPPTFVNHITGPGGQLVYSGETKGRRVFSPLIAEEALIALQATVQYGTGTAAALPNVAVAGKTGTTELSDDAWFNGITPTFAASVWLGDPVRRYPMYIDGQEVYGASYPTQIWRAVAQYALQGVPYIAWPTPDYNLMPPVKYIISPGLERDDLFAHGYPPPAAPTSVPSTTGVPFIKPAVPPAKTTPPIGPRVATGTVPGLRRT
jgi:penicillin-binding protein 1A